MPVLAASFTYIALVAALVVAIRVGTIAIKLVQALATLIVLLRLSSTEALVESTLVLRPAVEASLAILRRLGALLITLVALAHLNASAAVCIRSRWRTWSSITTASLGGAILIV